MKIEEELVFKKKNTYIYIANFTEFLPKFEETVALFVARYNISVYFQIPFIIILFR